jgi:hypothetical protein
MTRDSKMRENKQTTQCGDHAAHNNYNEKKKREKELRHRGAKKARMHQQKHAHTKQSKVLQLDC